MQNTPIIVAGAGPSLAKIDYYRVPHDIKILRVNDFYFEEKYYLGKNVDFYNTFGGPNAKNITSQYYTLYNLKRNKEYYFDAIYYSTMHDKMEPLSYLPDSWPLIMENKDLLMLTTFYKNYHNVWLNTGITSLFLAYTLGFRKIYMTGFDFYSGQAYPWSNPNNKALQPNMASHPQNIQLEALEILKNLPDIEVFSISPESKLNDYVPLAPRLPEANNLLEEKADDCIRTRLPLPEDFLEKEKMVILQEKYAKKSTLKRFFYRMNYQRIRILSHLLSGKAKAKYKCKKEQYKKIIAHNP